MAFFDLNIPYSYPSPSGGKELIVGNKLRVKLATKAMELGYVGIAHNHSIEGVMSEKDSCTIPLLTLGSLVKAAPRLASSVGFHRDLHGVPRSTPFRQYTRVTVKLESKAQCLGLNSGNPVLKSYDVVAVRPMNQFAFDQACTKAEVDIISIDFSNLQFRLMHPSVKAAVKRGIYFEIKYSHLLSDAEKRRQVISNAKLLVDWTKGKNLIISSGAPSENKCPPSVTELRGPNDVINLMSLLGLSSERARAAISVNCRNMIAKILKKKRFHKEAVRVELLSSSETFSLEQPLSGDCMKWDPLSSGEGDMLLEDLAKAFEATTRAVAHKPFKAFDVTSDRNGMPSHGFRISNILGTEPLTQPPAAKMIDAPVQCKNQVSEVSMVDSASCVYNLRENETVSQIDMLVSEEDNKVEPTRIVPLSSEGLLVQDEAAASFTPITCTKSDAASDVHMQTELDSEDKAMSPSKCGHMIQQSHVENLNTETIGVDDEVPEDGVNKEGAVSGHAIIEQPTSTHGDDVDEMTIDASLEANDDEYMEVTVEDQKHETGDNNIILPNLTSSESTDLLRESSNSLSPEAVVQDHDQVPSLESSEAELGEEVQYDVAMEDKKETETNQQAHVKSSERNNARNSGKVRAKRSWVRLTQLQPLKPFLLQRFKRISKRRKLRRA